MADRFDEELKRSLNVQASRVPTRGGLGGSAMLRARGIQRRRRVVGSAVAAGLVAIAIPIWLQVGDAASRGDGDPGPATPDVTETNVLTVTREDGSTFDLTGAQVECDWIRQGVLTVRSEGARLFDEGAPSFFIFDNVLRELSTPTTITLPPDRSSAARLFVVDAKTQNELVSTEEESSGSFVIERASCDPVPEIEVRIDATLASEFSDGETVKVQGTLSLRGG